MFYHIERNLNIVFRLGKYRYSYSTRITARSPIAYSAFYVKGFCYGFYHGRRDIPTPQVTLGAIQTEETLHEEGLYRGDGTRT